MRTIITVILIMIVFTQTGCLTSKRVDKWVAAQYVERLVTTEKN
jgi:hypothetical protein